MAAEQFHEANEKNSPEAKDLSPEQLEKYLNVESSLERAAEKSKLENVEKAEANARVEALKQAISVEAGSAEKKTKARTGSPAKRRHGVVSKKERNTSYKRHVKQLQSELKPSQRAFSKVIHNPVIEKTSEAVGNTVARPNAILAGAMVAFFLVLAVYLVAKFYGYPLSGFETIGAFIVGWVLGILYDFFKVMITGKKA
ncbi:MAG: hypothetical protein WAR37_03105 [Candidatus Microsaccharimonas sp.]